MEKFKEGFTCSETKILGMKYMDANGKWHFMPAPDFRDKYLTAYLEHLKFTRPVNVITKELA